MKFTGKTKGYECGLVRIISHFGPDGGGVIYFNIRSRVLAEDLGGHVGGAETEVVIPAAAMRAIVDLLGGPTAETKR